MFTPVAPSTSSYQSILSVNNSPELAIWRRSAVIYLVCDNESGYLLRCDDTSVDTDHDDLENTDNIDDQLRATLSETIEMFPTSICLWQIMWWHYW